MYKRHFIQMAFFYVYTFWTVYLFIYTVADCFIKKKKSFLY